MLILSRKWSERIILQVPGFRDIIIEVTDTSREKVRLAFDAPKEIKVWREELLPKDQSPPQ